MYIELDRCSEMPMIKQLYSQVRDGILRGSIESGYKLPSTRALAKELSISRVVVLEAYEQLIAEGYLDSKQGSGTYVAQIDLLSDMTGMAHGTNEVKFEKAGLRSESEEGIIDMRTGAPELSLFPIEKWGKLYHDMCRDMDYKHLDYYKAGGSNLLKVQILNYLNRSRGIVAKPSQVFITTGAAQAFTLVGRMLAGDNELVITEDPVNKDIVESFTRIGYDVLSCGVDVEGLITDEIPWEKRPKLIFTSPSHQYPLGSILSIKRRLELIKGIREADAYIIEDDYDSAFRFAGQPVSALYTLDSERVIYCGTFSKVLFPALRIGYAIVPEGLVEQFDDVKFLEDIHTPILEQMTLAKFIEEGLLERHINKLRKHYQKKNHILVNALIEQFGGKVAILGDKAGMHLVAVFEGSVINDKMYDKLYQNGLKLARIEDHTAYPERFLNKIMIGYGHLSEEEIVKGVAILAEQLEG